MLACPVPLALCLLVRMLRVLVSMQNSLVSVYSYRNNTTVFLVLCMTDL